MTMPESLSARGYPDLHDHLKALDEAGLLITIDKPVNKDTEMHPLVRWQFQGGIAEKDRKAFLFTNITDAKGRKYDMPVVIGALAANAEIYSVGMGCPVEEIGDNWNRAIANPIDPIVVDSAPCQDVIIEGADLVGDGNGVDGLPIPISTPGFDCAPYFSATNFITKDPENGIQNMGTYRVGLKAPDRLAVRMVARPGGAGGLVGAPIQQVQAHSVDLRIPAESELVIEGFIDTEYLEPEGPFGESHGHIALEDYNMIMRVTAITRRKGAVMPSIISQVTPSESSVIKRVAYEPLWTKHLKSDLGIQGVQRVVMHEPLTNLRTFVFIQFERGTTRTEIWRGLYGAANLMPQVGKFCVAINDDIDPDSPDSVLWALSYRCNPIEDTHVMPHQVRGHGPKADINGEPSSMLMDATMNGGMPPLALPKKEFMENAKTLWEELGLPPLSPQAPWYGYSLGNWSDEWERAADRAVQGIYQENGRISEQRQRKGLHPETPVD
jgi:4-hydroxy-3-polyprenylbenzoate decarboxylase